MGVLDPILLAFIAGMAVRDLWPLWIRREAEHAKKGGLLITPPLVQFHIVDIVRAKPKPCRSLPGTRR